MNTFGVRKLVRTWLLRLPTIQFLTVQLPDTALLVCITEYNIAHCEVALIIEHCRHLDLIKTNKNMAMH